MPLAAARAFLEGERRSTRLSVRRVPFAAMDEWRFDTSGPLRLVHRTGRFFSVEGARFRAEDGTLREQPVLVQEEIGLLGVLMTRFGGVAHLLVQAKWEPGNRAAQLSPTVQATHSNYTRAHGGRAQLYLGHFLDAAPDAVVFDALMPEHGTHFLRKKNRNVVVEVPPDLEVAPGFAWLTLGQLKALLCEDDVVHMDTRSVIACLPFASASIDDPVAERADERTAALLASARARSATDLESWLARAPIDVERRPLDALSGWVLDADAVRTADGSGPFSIIGVSVEADRREVARWTQPMIAPARETFSGLVCRREEGVLELLVEARQEPGEACAHVFPTVSAPDGGGAFAASLREAQHTLLFSARNSEEGGRFFRYDQRFVVAEVTAGKVDVSPRQRWLTLGDVRILAERGHVSMDLRNLLACLPLPGR